MMKISLSFFQPVFAGGLTCWLLSGCAQSHQGKPVEHTFLPGPVIYRGVEYFPAKPGATYHNAPIEYTTNRPAPDKYTFVKLVSTNGITIHLKEAVGSTNTMTIPNLQ